MANQSEKEYTRNKSRLKVKPFHCPHCAKTFLTRFQLTCHVRVHTGERPFGCDIRSKHFSQKASLSAHRKTHSGERNYACTYCPRKYTAKTRLEDHLRSHTGEKPYKCDVCGDLFSTQRAMKTHVRFLHSTTSRSLCKCPHCDREFSRAAPLQRHIKEHHTKEDQQARCRTCGGTFRNQASLRKHKRDDHPKQYNCNLCPKSYSNKGSITDHLKTHTGEKPVPCGLCGQEFVKPSALATHIKTSHQPRVRSLQCDWCPLKFYDKRSLKTHCSLWCKQRPECREDIERRVQQNAETGEHNFFCNLCARAFPTKWHLQSHAKIHDRRRKRKFGCDLCGRRFFNKGHLKRHQTESVEFCKTQQRKVRETQLLNEPFDQRSLRELRVILPQLPSNFLQFTN